MGNATATGTGTGTGLAIRRRERARHGALALWLVVLMFLAPVLGAAKTDSAGQIVPALFVVPLLALGVLSAAHVGRIVLAHQAPGVSTGERL